MFVVAEPPGSWRHYRVFKAAARWQTLCQHHQFNVSDRLKIIVPSSTFLFADLLNVYTFIESFSIHDILYFSNADKGQVIDNTESIADRFQLIIKYLEGTYLLIKR